MLIINKQIFFNPDVNMWTNHIILKNTNFINNVKINNYDFILN